MTTSSAAMRLLAGRILELEEQVKKTKVPQLAYSTLEAGAVTVVDGFDNEIGAVGQQFDGSTAAVEFIGPTPLTPSMPILSTTTAALSVRWDGLWSDGLVVPVNFTRVEIHIQQGSEPTGDVASTIYGTFETPRGGEQTFTLAPGTYYVAFVARNLSGARGPRSVAASLVVEAVVADADLTQITSDVEAANTAAKAAKDAAAQIPVDVTSGAIVAGAIADGTVVAGKIATNAVIAGTIAANAVTAATVAADAILARNIKAGEVTAGKLAALAVEAGNIAANAVTASTIKAGEVVAGKLAAGAVIAGNIDANAVTTSTLAADAVTAKAVAAGAIGAKQLIVADTANMSEVQEAAAGAVTWAGWKHIIELDASGAPWSKRDLTTSQNFMFRNQVGPLPFKNGDRIRVTFEAYADAAVTPTARWWSYATPTSPSSMVAATLTATTGSPTQITTAPQSFAYEGPISGLTSETAFLIGMAGVAGRDVRVRNVRAYVMNAGELIVQGSITTEKLDANAINGLLITGTTIRTAASGTRMQLRPGPAKNGFGNGVLEFFTGNVLENAPAEIFTIADGPLGTDNISLMIQSPAKTGYSGRGSIQLFAEDADNKSNAFLWANDVNVIGNGSVIVATGTTTNGVYPNRVQVNSNGTVEMWSLGTKRVSLYDTGFVVSGGVWGDDVVSGGSSVGRGWCGYASVTGVTGSTSSTSVVNVPGLTFTVSVVKGRRYRISAWIQAASSAADDRIGLVIRDGTTQLVGSFAQAQVANVGYPCYLEAHFTASATGSKTYTVGYYRNAGSGDVSIIAGPQAPTFLALEDIGGS